MALPMLVKRMVDSKLSKYCEQKAPRVPRGRNAIFHKVRGNSVTLLESRPNFRNPKESAEIPIAQFRYDPDRNIWSLYSADRKNRWHFYENIEPTPNLSELLAAVDKDPTGVFWG